MILNLKDHEVEMLWKFVNTKPVYKKMTWALYTKLEKLEQARKG